MKIRLLLFIALICCTSTVSFSQQTVYYQSISAELHQAKELYLKNKFIAAQNQFTSIADKSEKGTEINSEATFYQALCALKLESGNGQELMQDFVDNNSESPYANRAWFELGNTLFNNNRFPQMLRAYQNLKTNSLSKEEQSKVTYQKGYANFQSENYVAAEREFVRIKDSKSKMAAPAKYYWAHIQYLNEKYETALQVFEELKSNQAFASVVPYYISQIYYKQEKYEQVVEYAIPLMETADKQNRAAIAKILGNSYFHLNKYSEAIPYFEDYFQESQSRQPDENYMMGYCYHVTQQYHKATEPLEIASQGKDELAQNAYYHLADCYIKTNDKGKARVAFESASGMDFNESIKEDALFNYAKITYELSYSPFNETIKAFDEYIALYPNSERNDAAYDYLVKVYMSTNNYQEAITSIEKIQVKNASINKAWQRVTFYRGLELINNLEYQSALENFNQSLANGNYDQSLKAAATFWKAESHYRMNNYDQAIIGYNQFIRSPGADARNEYQIVPYNLAYAYFKLKEYEQAAKAFNQYISDNKGNNDDKLGDAYNRLADCYYIDRDYTNAIHNYQQSYDLRTYDSDYALFQLAQCFGLQKEPALKISQLRNLLENFPKSAFADDALYELGRTFERTNDSKSAISYYENILKEHPQSSYQPKALLQLGLIYFNQSEYNKSLRYYKQVAEDHPNSEETQSALLGIKNNYVELNNVDAYFSYANKLGSGTRVSVSEQDSLTYLSAEKLVMNSDSKARAQLERYLEQYPSGSFSMNAHFYLAENKYASGEYSSALSDYEHVLDKSDNIFTEAALAKAAELQYNSADYAKALPYFERLEKISNTKWNLLKARAGKMRCYYDQADYKSCIDAATILLSSDKLTDEMKREANFKLSKSYYLTNSYEKALPLLGELAEDTKSEEGAESKYLLTEILVSQNKLDDAESEVMDFISKNTPHQYWLAKSFILLADIYLNKGDEFQAKHTIKSIVENYPVDDDGILETAKAKLQHLEELEAQQQQEKDSPLQIDINQQ